MERAFTLAVVGALGAAVGLMAYRYTGNAGAGVIASTLLGLAMGFTRNRFF